MRSALDKVDDRRGRMWAATLADQWATNTLVHYNEWENLQVHEFEPIVAAFRELESLFYHDCGSYIEAKPNWRRADIVHCYCGDVTWNLHQKT